MTTPTPRLAPDKAAKEATVDISVTPSQWSALLKWFRRCGIEFNVMQEPEFPVDK